MSSKLPLRTASAALLTWSPVDSPACGYFRSPLTMSDIVNSNSCLAVNASMRRRTSFRLDVILMSSTGPSPVYDLAGCHQLHTA
ncbi:hypothetical protein L7Q78_21355, partial [Achromobacter xylosoxidans]|nr:hypothetical protein [Achromobacter xylosoxidans]